ncbi:MAG: hypothetical protein ABL930_02140 [Pseudobdellovibrio sp.]
MFKKSALIISVFLFFVGCQTTGFMIEESNYSVKQHRIAVTAALGQVRSVSENGRVILSYYHDKTLKGIEITTKTRERLYTKVAILGSRRPYRVSIEVHVEQRDPYSKKFYEIGLDESLGRKRAIAIREMLNQSRDETSSFDEENPF